MSNLPTGFVPVPLNLLRFIQLEKLSPSETAILAYIVEQSLNFQRGGRAWVAISPAYFGESFLIHPKRVQVSLTRLVNIGIIEEKKESIRTRGGVQSGRAFRITTLEKLGEICAKLSAQNEYKVVAKSLPPKIMDNSKGAAKSLLPRSDFATTLELFRYYLGSDFATTFWRNEPNPLIILGSEELKECINNFLRSFSSYEFSYFELIALCYRQRRSIRNLELKMDALVADYGPFSAWVSIIAFATSQDVLKGNFEALPMFAKVNALTIQDAWEKIKKSVDDLFFELQDLTLDRGRAKASTGDEVAMLFAKRSLDESRPSLMFYEEFQRHVTESFAENHFSVSAFTSDLTKKMNIYFRAKIYGKRELVLADFYRKS